MYLVLGDDGRLLYVGKALSLKRRLADHARDAVEPRERRLGSHAREVRTLVCPSEREAHCREADLITAFAPPYNASMRGEEWTYIALADVPTRADPYRVRFALSLDGRASRSYGGFPHLGKGRASWRGVRTNAGYSALLRLLWVSFADDAGRERIPGRLRGSSPPVRHEAPVAPEHARALHDLLGGRSRRLLRTLRASATSELVPEYMHVALLNDVVDAEEFYVIGPRRLRQFRLRHGLGAATVDAPTFAALVAAETVAEIGPIVTK